MLDQIMILRKSKALTTLLFSGMPLGFAQSTSTSQQVQLTVKQPLNGTGLSLMLPQGYLVKRTPVSSNVTVFNVFGPGLEGEFNVTLLSPITQEQDNSPDGQLTESPLNQLINFTMGFLEGVVQQQTRSGGRGTIDEVYFTNKRAVPFSQASISLTGAAPASYLATIYKNGNRAAIIAYLDKSPRSTNDQGVAQRIMESLQGL
ncbi:hypothetical protein E5F05_03270 (plasmid) [Deinococcus metallilatus]|uniref:DUF1795 domain-containing protein n=1 Tax=Deinococcus metallilatus TaxID=1211322 RepID=A0AAJ5K189_9DEIO|nr:hypothetical protein [Deinococcus metallilatus]MBB5297303.1 hypothetical protein [Deinococcus metallilatus]QBY06951.1 hypothetical protein E5F05_03270 [Deinococcus metallilatus]TLK31898.1 hypothetical protein FCS05_00035 [Deinococcus metallilatus]GMA17133.1 hypothetical protein GCM10025871_34640 [Deinococcus metallilatus]